MKLRNVMAACAWPMVLMGALGAQTVNVAKFGAKADDRSDSSAAVQRAIAAAQKLKSPTIVFPKGRYDFWPAQAAQRHYFISNHDFVDSRAVALPLEDMKNLTVDGQGSTFILHGLMMPVAVVSGENTTLRNFSIDYETPHQLQTKVLRAGNGSFDVQVQAGKYAIEDGKVQIIAEDWKGPVTLGLEFDAASKALAWNAKDTKFTGAEVKELSPGMLQFSGVKLAPTVGDILILREADRPDPAVWVSESKSITVSNVTVHSGLGMGFIAQRSQDVHLDHFSVALADGSPCYITTNADGAHFSQCRGNITVENGLFENMLDDGINVHGVYLRVVKLTAPDTVLAEFGHSQAFGFSFADAGDHIQFDNPKTLLDYATGVVKSVNAPDPHHVQLVFQSAVPAQIKPGDALDDVDWWPTVIYRNNTVRHNRARGSVLKSPRSILVEGNTYDHLSGTAILLADDASNWYESTPASNMIIRNNTITDPMISSYGSAPIFTKFAIDPTQEGDRYNSHNILIEGNTFNLFQRSLLDMTSVDGLIFRNNTVKLNHDFKPNIAEDASPITLNHVRCVMIGDNKLPWMMTPSDVSAEDAKLLSVGSGDGGSQKEWDSACTTSVTGAH